MKSILIATDLSARSDRALDRAVILAQARGARLTVVHIVDQDLPASLADAQKQAAHDAISSHLATLASGDEPQVSIAVVFGHSGSNILDMAANVAAELIVVGVPREDAFKDMFRGTTAERIIRAGDVPVLLVKDRATTPYRRIMVGVDFSVYSRRAVEFAVSFVPDGHFHLVHAYDVPFKGFLYGHDTRREVTKQHQVQLEQMINGEMATFLASVPAAGAKLEQIMQEGAPRSVIAEQARRLSPDLLIIGTHGRTGVAHAFLGSVAEDLLRTPPCDVLAVRAW